MTLLRLHRTAESASDPGATDPEAPVLVNPLESRSDWGEFGPILDYLRQHTLEDGVFHGFLPPSFCSLTGHSHADLEALLARHGPSIDVLLCSPHPSQLAYFLNVIEHGEYFRPGLAEAARQWMRAAGLGECPVHAPTDARQMVFGTSFVARPSFWREWLRWCESLASHCGAAASPLQHMLTAGGSPPGHQPMQQMLAERLASLILAVQPHWRCEAANPYMHQRWPTDQLRRDPTDAIVSDALKHAWRQTGWAEYVSAFGQLRQRMLAGQS